MVWQVSPAQIDYGDALTAMDYRVETKPRTSGPITAIWFDHKHGTFWGGASNYGEDYGIAW